MTKATKIHKQFSHPVDSNKLKSLLRNADIYDKDLFCGKNVVIDTCDTSGWYKKAHSVVSLPIAFNFNECLAVDLKFLTVKGHKHIILQMIYVSPGLVQQH